MTQLILLPEELLLTSLCKEDFFPDFSEQRGKGSRGEGMYLCAKRYPSEEERMKLHPAQHTSLERVPMKLPFF